MYFLKIIKNLNLSNKTKTLPYRIPHILPTFLFLYTWIYIDTTNVYTFQEDCQKHCHVKKKNNNKNIHKNGEKNKTNSRAIPPILYS